MQFIIISNESRRLSLLINQTIVDDFTVRKKKY